LQWAQLSSGAPVISHFFQAITRILGRGVQRAKEVARCGCYIVGVTQMVTRIESTGEIQLDEGAATNGSPTRGPERCQR